MSFATGFEGFVQLLPWGRFDFEEGALIAGTRPWFSWGFVTRHNGKAHGWYILLALPSYSMQVAPWRDGPPTWHQLHLLFRGTLPAGNEGWRLIDLECERTYGDNER